jgi:GntR family transcriptional regulator
MSLSQRLHESLAQLIAATEPGGRLPSEPELSKQLKVSRATLREAMRTFETQGLIYRRQGSGTFVTHPSQIIERGREVLVCIETLAKRFGLTVAMGEMRIERRLASEEESKALGLAPGAGVVCLTRVILAHGHPAAYLIDVLPDDILVPDELKPGFTGSVLDLLLQRGSPPLASSRCEINAVTATREIAHAMRIQRGDVLMRFEAYLYAADGRVVDYSFSYFLPGYFRFHVVRRVEM